MNKVGVTLAVLGGVVGATAVIGSTAFAIDNKAAVGGYLKGDNIYSSEEYKKQENINNELKDVNGNLLAENEKLKAENNELLDENNNLIIENDRLQDLINSQPNEEDLTYEQRWERYFAGQDNYCKLNHKVELQAFLYVTNCNEFENKFISLGTVDYDIFERYSNLKPVGYKIDTFDSEFVDINSVQFGNEFGCHTIIAYCLRMPTVNIYDNGFDYGQYNFDNGSFTKEFKFEPAYIDGYEFIGFSTEEFNKDCIIDIDTYDSYSVENINNLYSIYTDKEGNVYDYRNYLVYDLEFIEFEGSNIMLQYQNNELQGEVPAGLDLPGYTFVGWTDKYSDKITEETISSIYNTKEDFVNITEFKLFHGLYIKENSDVTNLENYVISSSIYNIHFRQYVVTKDMADITEADLTETSHVIIGDDFSLIRDSISESLNAYDYTGNYQYSLILFMGNDLKDYMVMDTVKSLDELNVKELAYYSLLIEQVD